MVSEKLKKNSKKIVSTFVNFLEEERETKLLSEVARELQNMAANTKKGQKIQVISAVKLDEDEQKKLKAFFKRVLNKEYSLENIVNPAILGGLKVKWGDFMLDMTLRSRLTQLRLNLQ